MRQKGAVHQNMIRLLAAGDFLEDHPTVHGISERNWGLVHPSMGKCHEDWDLLTITRVINPGYQWSSRVVNQAY